MKTDPLTRWPTSPFTPVTPHCRILWPMRSGVSSGGVVFWGSQVLLVQYQDGSWTYPKGHIEEGEEARQAAEREVLEETGVQARALEHLGVTRYTNNRGVAREVHWFLMEAGSEVVQLEDTFAQGGFYGLSQARDALSFAEDRQLLERAIQVRAGH